jgi:8-oxo-(d)GTP phosphatase
MALFLVRHAQAGSRAVSNLPDDTLRPLTREGRHQAAALVGLLDEMGATSVYTSPYRRCVQTAVPLGAHLGVPVVETDDLGEGSADGAIALVRKLANDNAALFSHGDIIPGVLEYLVANDSLDLGPSPRCQKGSIWMLETDGISDTFVKSTYVPAWRFNVGPAD